jgi:hypothetical protein
MNSVRQPRRLGIIGSIVGLFALVASALTQLLPAVPVSEPVRHATEAAGPADKGRWSFRLNRFEIRSHEASEPRTAGTASYDWNQVLSTTAVALGLLAIAFAVFAVIMKEERLLAGIAAALGCTAIAVQIYWVVIIVVVVMAIANAIFS